MSGFGESGKTTSGTGILLSFIVPIITEIKSTNLQILRTKELYTCWCVVRSEGFLIRKAIAIQNQWAPPLMVSPFPFKKPTQNTTEIGLALLVTRNVTNFNLWQ